MKITIVATTMAFATLQSSGCATVRVPDDDVITARVKSELGRAVPRSATDIIVTSDDGVVVLSGPVSSSDAAMRAIQAAQQVDGVKLVRHNLQVAERPQ